MLEQPDLPPPDLESVLEFFATSPHHQATGISVVSADAKMARMQVLYDKRFIGDPDTGAVHGGRVATMMDATGGLAVLAKVPAGTAIAPLDLRLDYLRSAKPGEDQERTAELVLEFDEPPTELSVKQKKCRLLLLAYEDGAGLNLQHGCHHVVLYAPLASRLDQRGPPRSPAESRVVRPTAVVGLCRHSDAEVQPKSWS
mgnify:CR=1 FL=1